MNRYPELLIGEYNKNLNFESIKKNILRDEYCSLDLEAPMSRFRGTIIKFNPENRSKEIIGWQRNVSRINKMDVSLPTIITVGLNNDDTVKDIELDASFKGSKGLLCSRKYFDQNLKQIFRGTKLDDNLSCYLKVNKLHCFHLVEVLGGIYSYYRAIKNDLSESGLIWFEEEATSNITRNGNLYFFGQHNIKKQIPVKYAFHFDNFLHGVSFDEHGNVSSIKDVNIKFFVGDSLIMSKSIHANDKGAIFSQFQKFFFHCLKHCYSSIYNQSKTRLMHTNLYPPALVGLLVQSAAMVLFKNNYGYVMHVLTALQRSNGIPKCTGAITSHHEARESFPNFSLDMA